LVFAWIRWDVDNGGSASGFVASLLMLARVLAPFDEVILDNPRGLIWKGSASSRWPVHPRKSGGGVCDSTGASKSTRRVKNASKRMTFFS